MVLFLDGQILIPERNQVLEIRASLGHHYLVYLILLLQNNDDVLSGQATTPKTSLLDLCLLPRSLTQVGSTSDRPGTRYTAALIMVF